MNERSSDAADRSPRLVEAGRYRREVGGSLARVWENVFDWEHLPALHAESFASVELLGRDAGGWRIGLIPQPGDPGGRQVLKLDADRVAGTYTVRTEQGRGAGVEIVTRLSPLDADRTAVEVAFLIPDLAPERVASVGERLAQTYAQLWDEDEAMIRRREAMSRREAEGAPPPLSLGPVQTVRAASPFTVEFGGRPVRVALVDDELIAFSAVCPHWLGPLDETPVVNGEVRCPWHGYRFDVRTGCSADGRGLTLDPPPQVRVETGHVWLSREAGGG